MRSEDVVMGMFGEGNDNDAMGKKLNKTQYGSLLQCYVEMRINANDDPGTMGNEEKERRGYAIFGTRM
jgi:hypothetical protein